MTQKIFTAASLFCGAGGLDMGFERAGFKTIWANDNDKDACKTFESWNPSAKVVCSKIELIKPDSIPDIDVILGGFPCQGFSVAGNRDLNDPRNKLYLNYVEIVRQKQPLAFVGENVPGLLSMARGKVFLQIVEDFTKAGYHVYYQILNASNYEVPQDRTRVIIVGLRNDLKIDYFRYPQMSERRVTLADALKDVRKPEVNEVGRFNVSSRYMSRNRKRDWNDVSYTILALSRTLPLHPSSPDMIKVGKETWKFGDGVSRQFNVPECAAIQTFPSNMRFVGSYSSKIRQIGNAVPVKLAEAIGRSLYDCLIKATSK